MKSQHDAEDFRQGKITRVFHHPSFQSASLTGVSPGTGSLWHFPHNRRISSNYTGARLAARPIFHSMKLTILHQRSGILTRIGRASPPTC